MLKKDTVWSRQIALRYFLKVQRFRVGSLSAIDISVCNVNVFCSFSLQATLQICLQHPWASAALRQKLQLQLCYRCTIQHEIITPTQALLGADREVTFVFAWQQWLSRYHFVTLYSIQNQHIFKYSKAVMAAFPHLYILDKDISFHWSLFTEIKTALM